MSNRGFGGFDDDDKYGKAKKQNIKGSPPVHNNRCAHAEDGGHPIPMSKQSQAAAATLPPNRANFCLLCWVLMKGEVL